jgi:hypothetical protein
MKIQKNRRKQKHKITLFISIPVPEFIDQRFVKTSPKRSYSVIENERFGLVFAKTVSIILGTGFQSEHPLTTVEYEGHTANAGRVRIQYNVWFPFMFSDK